MAGQQSEYGNHRRFCQSKYCRRHKDLCSRRKTGICGPIGDYLIQRDTPAESAIWGEGKCAITDLGPLGTNTYVWPTTETRISGYEWTPDVGHYGIDIGGKKGNPIYTVDNGVVVYAGWSTWGYGNVVAIDHGNDLQTIYAHLDSSMSPAIRVVIREIRSGQWAAPATPAARICILRFGRAPYA